MEELFNKPILDQMYEFRKKEFEQSVYDKNEEIRSIQNKKCEIGKAFTEFLKEVITDEKNYNKLLKMFNDYEQESDNELELWGKAYFKLGMIDRVKIRNEILRFLFILCVVVSLTTILSSFSVLMRRIALKIRRISNTPATK